MTQEPAPDDALKGFGARLAHLIQQEPGRGKKRAFARKIGKKPQQLSRYLQGQIPDAPTLLAIAEAGLVSVDWLLTGRGPGDAEAGAGRSALHRAILRRLARVPTPVALALLHVLEALDVWGTGDPWR
jgi:transcriptional regulator with XRE-family HTH domain